MNHLLIPLLPFPLRTATGSCPTVNIHLNNIFQISFSRSFASYRSKNLNYE
jgi:hypothetical protein